MTGAIRPKALLTLLLGIDVFYFFSNELRVVLVLI